MDDWYNDHENWVEELKEFLARHLDDTEMESLEEDDLMFISNLAAKLRRGDIGIKHAIDEIHKWALHKQGFSQHHDKESFDLEVAYSDMVDITEGVKENLGVVDQPGIADAIIKMYVSEGTELDDEGHLYNEEGHIAFQAKGWFDVQGIHPAEAKDLNWAIATALRQHVEAN